MEGKVRRKEKATAVTEEGGHGGFDGVTALGAVRGANSGYILKVKLIGFSDRMVWGEKDREQLQDSRCVA